MHTRWCKTCLTFYQHDFRVASGHLWNEITAKVFQNWFTKGGVLLEIALIQKVKPVEQWEAFHIHFFSSFFFYWGSGRIKGKLITCSAQRLFPLSSSSDRKFGKDLWEGTQTPLKILTHATQQRRLPAVSLSRYPYINRRQITTLWFYSMVLLRRYPHIHTMTRITQSLDEKVRRHYNISNMVTAMLIKWIRDQWRPYLKICYILRRIGEGQQYILNALKGYTYICLLERKQRLRNIK